MSSNRTGARRSILFTLSGLIAISPFTMEAYLPALLVIAKDLETSLFEVNLTISLYLLGIGIGQFFGGPISDQIGRLKNVILGLSIFVLSSTGILFSNDIHTIQILRFTQAFGAGFASIVGLPVVRDIFTVQESIKTVPRVQAVMLIAPMIAPIVGTILLQWHWRSIFLFLNIYAVIILILFIKIIGETKQNTYKFSFKKILSQYKDVANHKIGASYIAIKYVFIAALTSGVFLTLITHSTWVYLSHFDVPLALLPIFFGIHGLVLIIANLALSHLLTSVDASKLLNITIKVQLTLLTVLFGLNQIYNISLPIYVVLISLIMGTGAMSVGCVMAKIFTYFDELSGSAVALISLFRGLSAGLLGAISGLFFNHTLTPIFLTIIASSMCAFFIHLSLPKE